MSASPPPLSRTLARSFCPGLTALSSPASAKAPSMRVGLSPPGRPLGPLLLSAGAVPAGHLPAPPPAQLARDHSGFGLPGPPSAKAPSMRVGVSPPGRPLGSLLLSAGTGPAGHLPAHSPKQPARGHSGCGLPEMVAGSADWTNDSAIPFTAARFAHSFADQTSIDECKYILNEIDLAGTE